jgi:hypothetical protein
VNLLSRDGKRFLVAPRGYTQWVRKAQASSTVSLKNGRRYEEVRLRVISDEDKPEILKVYLDSFTRTVQRYFPVPAGSPVETFGPLAARYPVFELVKK